MPPRRSLPAALAVALPLALVPARATAQADSASLRQAADSLMRAWLATNPDRGFLSAGNEIGYGVEYLAAGKPTEASWSLERAVRTDSTNAYGHLFLGLAYVGMQRGQDAQRELAAAARLQPALAAAARDWTERAGRAAAARTVAAAAPATPAAPVAPVAPVAAAPATPAPAAARPAAPRPATPAPAPARPAAPARPEPLVLGTYACTHDYTTGSTGGGYTFRHDPVGYVVLKAGGVYQWGDNGQGGRYRYDAATRTLTWIGGRLGNAPSRTTFQRNAKTAQIDIEWESAYRWSCGKNL